MRLGGPSTSECSSSIWWLVDFRTNRCYAKKIDLLISEDFQVKSTKDLQHFQQEDSDWRIMIELLQIQLAPLPPFITNGYLIISGHDGFDLL